MLCAKHAVLHLLPLCAMVRACAPSCVLSCEHMRALTCLKSVESRDFLPRARYSRVQAWGSLARAYCARARASACGECSGLCGKQHWTNCQPPWTTIGNGKTQACPSQGLQAPIHTHAEALEHTHESARCVCHMATQKVLRPHIKTRAAAAAAAAAGSGERFSRFRRYALPGCCAASVHCPRLGCCTCHMGQGGGGHGAGAPCTQHQTSQGAPVCAASVHSI